MKMTTLFAFLAASLTPAICSAFVAQATPVTFDWATVGNPGNTPDTEVMEDGTTGYGAVAYSYRISKTEVTNAQYVKFLNTVAVTDTNSLYNTSMGGETIGGITRSGSSGSYTYAVKADSIGNGPGGADYTYGSKPVVFVSFFDAMRFTNWLENGQPTGAQNASTTEAGVYIIDSGFNEVRNSNATYFIPSEDEWYKAAYYDPNSGGGVYYDYPTSTDTFPDNNLPSSDSGNSANYSNGGTVHFSYPLTDVGAYSLSDSPYGTFDQGGNVAEWNEALFSSFSRGIRSIGWGGFSDQLAAPFRDYGGPEVENFSIGFRVASIPEPSTMLLGAMASVGLLMRRNNHEWH